MAITTQDIHSAADRIQAEGQQPTLAAVRAALGGGSFTTISEAMKRWKAAQQQQQASAPLREAAPQAVADRLAEVAAEVWGIAQAMANERLQSEREALDAARVEMEHAQAEAVELADALAADLDAARVEIEQQADAFKTAEVQAGQQALEIKALIETVAAAREDANVAEAALAESRARADELANMFNLERSRRAEAEQARATAEQSAAVLSARLDAAERRAEEAERRAEASAKDSAAARNAEQSARIAEQAAQARLESAAREIERATAITKEAHAEARAAVEVAGELRGKLAAIETRERNDE